MTSASAAGLNTLADRVRATYLLTTPIAAVKAVTRQGSRGLRIIATIIPVSSAPLGNSQAPFLTRRMGASTIIAAPTAATNPGQTCPTPSAGADTAASSTST